MSFAQYTSQIGSPLERNGLLRGGPLVAGVEVSVLTSESHTFSSDVTTLSLESGAEVSDHAIVKPEQVTVQVSMTNAGTGSDAARDAFETFRRLLEDRELLELVTEHAVYSNMIITSLTPKHTQPYKGALTLSIQLRRVHFVRLDSAGRLSASLPDGVIQKVAAAAENAGMQIPVSLDEAAAALSRVASPTALQATVVGAISKLSPLPGLASSLVQSGGGSQSSIPTLESLKRLLPKVTSTIQKVYRSKGY